MTLYRLDYYITRLFKQNPHTAIQTSTLCTKSIRSKSIQICIGKGMTNKELLIVYW